MRVWEDGRAVRSGSPHGPGEDVPGRSGASVHVYRAGIPADHSGLCP